MNQPQPPGATTIGAVLPTLLRDIGVAKVTLYVVPKPPAVQRRIATRRDTEQVTENALALRSNHGVPFWEGMLLGSLRAKKQTRDAILDVSDFHQPMSKVATEEELPIDSLHGRLRRWADSGDTSAVLAASSRVLTTRGEIAHVPMLDFRVHVSEEATDAVVTILGRLGVPGQLFNSGNSYHFYGALLFNETEFRRFLGSAILFTPLVDHRWIGHQLIEGACALRISEGLRGQREPFLLCKVK